MAWEGARPRAPRTGLHGGYTQTLDLVCPGLCESVRQLPDEDAIPPGDGPVSGTKRRRLVSGLANSLPDPFISNREPSLIDIDLGGKTAGEAPVAIGPVGQTFIRLAGVDYL